MVHLLDSQAEKADKKFKYAVILVCPENYIHSLGLLEIAETINYGLLNIGIDSILTDNFTTPDRNQIIIGGHLIHMLPNASIDSNAIIYNFEQIDSDSLWVNDSYITLLKSHPVWDYSKRNIELLKNFNVFNTTHVPLGYAKQLSRIIIEEKQDIDILFYGSINPRREHILNQLKNYGLNVKTLFGIYGSERDQLIAKSKIVLNIHFYETKIFEIARISYLLTNGVCIVSESGLSPEEDDFKKADALLLCEYDLLVHNCLMILNDTNRLNEIRRKGLDYMKTLKEENYLNNALFKCDSLKLKNNFSKEKLNFCNQYLPLPTILNMGSGKDWKEEAFNIDIQTNVNPDAIFDLNIEVPDEGVKFETLRFGNITLTQNHFDIIYSFDVLEHLTNLSTAMNTCLRFLKIGGLFKINVPYDLSWGAWQDPTHVRAFNERSWLYYTDWYWYFGWKKWRFDLISLEYILSSIGQEMHASGTSLEIILRTPRAVDSMLVELKKRELTAEEIDFVNSKHSRIV